MKAAKEYAEEVVDKIIADLNDRSGLGLYSVDEDIQAEIRDKWITIVKEAVGDAIRDAYDEAAERARPG